MEHWLKMGCYKSPNSLVKSAQLKLQIIFRFNYFDKTIINV